jgi:putative Mg2+ transporter-C (MgtC) family protein
MTPLDFMLRLSVGLILGAIIGLERQWRQRIAGTRTNALVAAGASSFTMVGIMLSHTDPSSAARMASYVVSGIGFLGAGVIFREGVNVRGLNTAATIWCSAAIGTLAGIGFPWYAVILAAAVLVANIALRPIAYKLYPVSPHDASVETTYAIRAVCQSREELYIRAHLIAAVEKMNSVLQSVSSADMETPDKVQVTAEVRMVGRQDAELEQVVSQLSLEPSITAVSWSAVSVSAE